MSKSFKRCPALADLPAPPPGRHGWPWDVESARLPDVAADGRPWPAISIVTPSYNQGQYIEETIRSVLLQGYPNLEFHVIDGGSSDETVEILRKYEPWLCSWVSEKDDGQSEAINKGFSRCGGELFNWLCSDDILTMDSLARVAEMFMRIPGTDAIGGACVFQYDDEPEKTVTRTVDWKDWELTPYSSVIWQPSCFFRRELVTRDNLVRTDLHYCMDRELWAYLCSRDAKWEWTDEALSVFRFTGANKSTTGGLKVIRELEIIYRSYVKETVPLASVLRLIWLPLVFASQTHKRTSIRFFARQASRGTSLLLSLVYPRVRLRSLQKEYYFHGQCALTDS
jgi:glycosyltransferase involved in cell wall biosynthesis